MRSLPITPSMPSSKLLKNQAGFTTPPPTKPVTTPPLLLRPSGLSQCLASSFPVCLLYVYHRPAYTATTRHLLDLAAISMISSYSLNASFLLYLPIPDPFPTSTQPPSLGVTSNDSCTRGSILYYSD